METGKGAAEWDRNSNVGWKRNEHEMGKMIQKSDDFLILKNCVVEGENILL